MSQHEPYEWLQNRYYGYPIPPNLFWDRVRAMGYEPRDDSGLKEWDLSRDRRVLKQSAVIPVLRQILIDANLYLKPAKAVLVQLKQLAKGKEEDEEGKQKKKKKGEIRYWWMIAMAYDGPCEERLLRKNSLPPDEVWTDLKKVLGLNLEDDKPEWGFGPPVQYIPQKRTPKLNHYYGYVIPPPVFSGKLRGLGYEPKEDDGASEFDLPPERLEQKSLAVHAALRQMLIDANLHLKLAKAVLVKMKPKVKPDDSEKDLKEGSQKRKEAPRYCWMIAMAYRGPCTEHLLLEDTIPPDEIWTDLKALLGLKEGENPVWGIGQPISWYVAEHDF
ncbi:hypothetical protein BJ138DRAFT_1166491 [Hygrophoropsis aurantiaca]|uniref:Uncharacterized protein n=1 Tax=Hygrophoropsis aurantiaca TaxID=72124 RepID=A0ACB7ZUN7_9AGAM|nr:hypothetical protein BJ138DRAFT_1166491 [Hygrophoropsis aurantiaca]